MKTHIKGKIDLTNKIYSILGEDKKTKAKTSARNQNTIIEAIKRTPFVGRGVVDYMQVK